MGVDSKNYDSELIHVDSPRFLIIGYVFYEYLNTWRDLVIPFRIMCSQNNIIAGAIRKFYFLVNWGVRFTRYSEISYNRSVPIVP